MALALTSIRFSLPYKAARTLALALLELVARREARREKDSIASVPQAPYASTTMGTQTHPLIPHHSALSSWVNHVTRLVWQPWQLRPTSSTPMDPSAKSWAGPASHWRWRLMAIGASRHMIPSPGWHPS